MATVLHGFFLLHLIPVLTLLASERLGHLELRHYVSARLLISEGFSLVFHTYSPFSKTLLLEAIHPDHASTCTLLASHSCFFINTSSNYAHFPQLTEAPLKHHHCQTRHNRERTWRNHFSLCGKLQTFNALCNCDAFTFLSLSPFR